MRYVLVLAIALSLTGCLQPHQEGGDPTPAVSAPAFYRALATYVESDQCETTDEFLKASAKAAKLRGVTLGEQWDAAFADIGKANADLTPDLRKEIADKCRGMK